MDAFQKSQTAERSPDMIHLKGRRGAEQHSPQRGNTKSKRQKVQLQTNAWSGQHMREAAFKKKWVAKKL